MAIAHINFKIITRGNGKCTRERSVVAAAAACLGEKIYCEYADQMYFYPRKNEGIIHTHVFLPLHAPEHLRDRAVLWNEVEWIEPQSNSQLAREVFIALPRELSREQNIALSRDYAQRFAEMGMVADLYAYDKGDGNPFAYILLTMRPFTEKGTWGMKSRAVFLLDEHDKRIRLPSGRYKSYKVCTTDWHTKQALLEWRKLYQDITNEHLSRAGVDARICVDSYEAQGIDRESMKHLGNGAANMEKRGIQTKCGERNRDIQARNQQRESINAEIARLLDAKAVLMQQQEEARREVASSKRRRKQPTEKPIGKS